MLLINDPPPVPSVVLVASATVGLEDVLQHTPLAVTPAIQFPVIFPPDEAVVVVIADIAIVVMAGRTVAVVRVR
jgi:hypothetical protein